MGSMSRTKHLFTVKLGPVVNDLHFAAPNPSEAEVEPQESQSFCLTYQGHSQAPMCGKKGVGPLEAKLTQKESIFSQAVSLFCLSQ